MTGSSNSSWFSIEYRSDPLTSSLVGEQEDHHGSTSSSSRHYHHHHGVQLLRDSRIVILKCNQDVLLNRLCNYHLSYQQAIQQGGRVAQVAVTDFLVRNFTTQYYSNNTTADDGSNSDDASLSFTLERLDLRSANGQSQRHQQLGRGSRNSKRSSQRRRFQRAAEALPPYMLERTDIGIAGGSGEFWWVLRLNMWEQQLQQQNDNQGAPKNGLQGRTTSSSSNGDDNMMANMEHETDRVVRTMVHNFISKTAPLSLLTHVAVAVTQDRLREALIKEGGVAFVAQGSILPRKSGASQAPMACPPAVPFAPPPNSPAMHRSLTIDLGRLRPFIDMKGTSSADDTNRMVTDDDNNTDEPSTTVTLEGLFIPQGVSLICGGGYHGKSTLLRCIAAGVYNKIPADGREYCVTRTDALSVRAEDGRYVHNCNISAFISNLPSLPGNPSSVDTEHFSTNEASGSTSQAANVIEALELGCQTMLVDEDVSAANFMARDGRMRALVQDESITPLLYRVNGLFKTHGVSSIVVVGGVGDWLDVPHHVILMDKYLCTDATAKAKSVSKQFSHGHVQYAGRGLVHRLNWDSTGTPVPRRPTDAFCQRHDFTNRHLALLDGGHGLALYRTSNRSTPKDGMMETSEHSNSSNSDNNDDDDEEDDERWIDMSRCEQLMGRKPQLYGCGLAALRLFALARQHPNKGLADLLSEWDRLVDEQGFFSQAQADETTWETTVVTLGAAMRPRALEVGQAVCRLRGIRFEELPPEDDGAEAAVQAEEERKKRELLEMWNNRRKK